MKAAGRGQVELARIAADLDEDGAKACDIRGLLGDPQGVNRLRRVGEKQAGGGQTEPPDETWRIGAAGLA